MRSHPPGRWTRWSRGAALSLTAVAPAGAGLVATAPLAAAEPECLNPSFDFDRDGIPDAVIGRPGAGDRFR